MKKSLVWVLLVGLAFGFSSCKKDDPAPVDAIVGAWALANYTYTGLPANFKRYEGYKSSIVIGFETGYSLDFKTDGTYGRAYVIDPAAIRAGYSSIYDNGTYVKDDSSVKLSPQSTTDLNLLQQYGGTPGTDFAIVSLGDKQMTLSVTATVYILPDSFDTTATPTNDDYKAVDCTVQLLFNRL